MGITFIYLYLFRQIGFSACQDYFSLDSSIAELSKLRFSGKGINEVGKYDSCIRAGNRYMKLTTYTEPPLFIGLCLPRECDPQALTQYTQQFDLKVIEPGSQPISAYGLIFITFFILYCIALLISTTLHCLSEKYLEYKLVQCFTMINAYKGLIKIREDNKLSVFNGLKVLSFAWVVYGHTLYFRLLIPAANVEAVLTIVQQWWCLVAISGFFAVDIFFYIAGFLLAYFLLIELKKSSGKIKLNLLYLHRYLRIVPTLVFVVAFDYFIIKAAGSGGMWEHTDKATLDCEKYLWTNLLFINNLYPSFEGNKCFGIGWYLANDMQFFLIGPAIVYFYFHSQNKKKAWTAFGLTAICSLLIPYSIAYSNNFRVNIFDPHNKDHFFFMFYTKPYIRFLPYFQGIIGGILLFAYEQRSQNPKQVPSDPLASRFVKQMLTNKYFSVGSALAGALLMIFFVLIQKPVYDNPQNLELWSRNTNAIILAILKPGFVLGLQLFTLPPMMQRVTVINKVLGHRLLEPFANITYCGFLAHLGVIVFYYSSQASGMGAGIYFFKDWVVFFLISSVLGTLLHLTVEVPFRNLEKLLFSAFK
jgi:peptidoglycan/LPS O-acetylase OafA/YrhL